VFAYCAHRPRRGSRLPTRGHDHSITQAVRRAIPSAGDVALQGASGGGADVDAIREQVHALIGALVLEREHALHRFQRLAVTELGGAGSGGGTDPCAIHAAAGAPLAVPDQTIASDASPASPMAEPAVDTVAEPPDDPTAERWGRIASWLEQLAGRS
jgi:hypothetical protein